MKHKQRNLRKAAVLVASLDADRAEAVLAQMTPAQAQAVRVAVEHLGPLDPAEQHEVIEEFFRIGPLLPDREISGIELTDPRCASLAIPPAAHRPHDATNGFASTPCDTPAGAAGQRSAAARHCDAAPEAIAGFLAREGPQTVAVFVSRLPSERAAEVLAALPAGTQVEVARRLLDLDETDPDILLEIERGLEAWLDEQARSNQRRAAGLATLNGILQASQPLARSQILAGIGRHEQAPAAEDDPSESCSLSFADLERFDPVSLLAVFSHAQSELVVLALAGARAEFAARALTLFPPAKAQLLRRALAHLGPTRLSDIELAQTELAQLATTMDERGEIRPRGTRHLSVAV